MLTQLFWSLVSAWPHEDSSQFSLNAGCSGHIAVPTKRGIKTLLSFLSHEVAFGSDIIPYIKIDKPLWWFTYLVTL